MKPGERTDRQCQKDARIYIYAAVTLFHLDKSAKYIAESRFFRISVLLLQKSKAGIKHALVEVLDNY